jgi:hypothetical protein
MASANRGEGFFENIIEALQITSTTRACLSFQRPVGQTRGLISNAITVAWRFLEGVVDVKELVSALVANGVTITTTNGTLSITDMETLTASHQRWISQQRKSQITRQVAKTKRKLDDNTGVPLPVPVKVTKKRAPRTIKRDTQARSVNNKKRKKGDPVVRAKKNKARERTAEQQHDVYVNRKNKRARETRTRVRASSYHQQVAWDLFPQLVALALFF